MFSNIKTRYWALLILVGWGAAFLTFGLLRFDGFGLDEGGAMALLLGWSISDQLATPIALYGGPDFRALPFYILLGLYWPGSMMAAKVFSLLVMYVGAMGFYLWSRDTENSEVALLSTGLLLIAPITVMQMDALGVGPYLLVLFGYGAMLDKRYRATEHSISSLFFVQMLLVVFATSLHPAGLAYPMALAWHWFKNPSQQEKQQKSIWIGSGVGIFIILVMQAGWIAIDWFSNPIHQLNNAVIGFTPFDDQQGWMLGAIVAVLLVIVCLRDVKFLLNNFLGSVLFFACLIGLLAADNAWALLAICLLLYRGFPQLIAINKALPVNNFAGQRGIVLAIFVVCSFIFMSADKAIAYSNKGELLSPTDLVIQTLAEEAADKDKKFFAASQWPARTMMICRRDTYRLPPPMESGEKLLSSMKGITHIVFNHRDPKYASLAKNLSEATNKTKTLSIQDGGVIMKIIGADIAESVRKAPAPKADTVPNSDDLTDKK